MSDEQLRAVDKLKVVDLKNELGKLGLSCSGGSANRFRYKVERTTGENREVLMVSDSVALIFVLLQVSKPISPKD